MDSRTAERFSALQADLGAAWHANLPGGDIEHVLIALPSHSAAESLIAHYGPRVRAMEHRYLVVFLMLHRVPRCELVFLCAQEPDPEVLEYYDSFVVDATGSSALDRFRVVVVDDGTPRPMSAKLLDRPDVLDHVRRGRAGRPAFIQPWNVTDLEVRVALELDAPLNGTSPELWPLGYKSSGRKLMRDAGVPVPYGREDVRSVDDVLTAVADVQAARPDATGVVVKLDDSGAGDGNVVIGLCAADGAPADDAEIRERVAGLADWYLTDLAGGGVVEELVGAAHFRSPSVQVGISPYGDVTVLATHEQVLGGDNGQVFTGCQLPADPAYSPEIARHAEAVGRALAARGAVGRVAVDFAVAGDGDRWESYALEINLRNGGTTHPFAVLRNLVPGTYDIGSGQWVSDADGTPRAYRATDNMVDIAWLGLAPSAVIAAVSEAGLRFDHAAGTGVVLHMLSSLAIDGRFGLTAIGHDVEHAGRLFDATREAVDGIKRS